MAHEHSKSQPSVFASIDQGSASTKMLILKRIPNGWETLVDKKIGTRLGHGVKNGGALPKENCERTIQALREMIALAEKHGIAAKDIPIIFTAVVRNSSNGAELIAMAKAIGLSKARVLSGAEEAALGYAGAVAQFGNSTTPFATVDLGGGSFQMAVGEGRTLTEGGSTQIGSNAIVQDWLPARILTASDFESADKALLELAPMPVSPDKLKGRKLVAIGGIPRLLACHFRAECLTRHQIDNFRHFLASLPVEERGPILQAGKSRAEQEAMGIDSPEGASGYGVKVPASSTLLLHIMKALNVDVLDVSTTDARHALISSETE